jgi:tRNA threonylcarbamoyladenosine biosynthesis protein TsaB
MRVLGIETSGELCGCAVVENERLLGERVSDSPGEHVEKLVHLVGSLLEEISVTPDGLDGVAVSLGPGSFTGLRIGLGTAKGMCFGAGLPLAGVPSLDAMAETACPWDGTIVAMRDARRGEIYTAVYCSAAGDVERLTDYRAMEPEAVGREIGDLARQGKTLVTGDALKRYGELLRGVLPGEVVFLPSERWMPSPSVVAGIGARLFKEGKTLDVGSSEPLYLRPSEAERQARKAGGSTRNDASQDQEDVTG